MSRFVALAWADVDHVRWGEIAAFNVSKADLAAIGLAFEVVEFDGLQVEIAAFRIESGDVAMIGSGHNSPDLLSLAVAADAGATPENFMVALGVEFERSEWQPLR
ncbi:hypothetical protein OG984_22680 [Nocardioides sp. NBC_00368]|uniref:hypothetical protein n=1 Tax=Nocardioides sp. NBC_00368 TaxID=2976000 RepID=UPI002E1D8A76